MSAPALAHCAMLGMVVGAIVLAWLGEHGDERLAAIVAGALAVIVVATVLIGTYDSTINFVGCP